MARVRISEKQKEKIRLENFITGLKKHRVLVVGIIVILIGGAMLLSSFVPHNVNSYFHETSGPLYVTNSSTTDFTFSSSANYITNFSVIFSTGQSVNYTLYTVHKYSPSPYVTNTVYSEISNGTLNSSFSSFVLGQKSYTVNYLIKFRANGTPANISADATIVMIAHAQAYTALEVAGTVIIFSGIGLIVYYLSRTKKNVN